MSNKPGMPRRWFVVCVLVWLWVLTGFMPGQLPGAMAEEDYGAGQAATAERSKGPTPVWLTWQQDPSTTMVIAWLTWEEKHDEDNLTYRKADDDSAAWTGAAATTKPMPGGAAYTIHTANLTGLEPDTIYAFRLSDGGKVRRFRTMPETLTRPIKLADGGDIYNDMKLLKPLCEQVGKFGPDFVILGGDIAYAGGNLDNAERWVKLMRVFMNKFVSPEGLSIPVVAVIGNHEVANGGFGRPNKDAPFFYSLFAYPGEQGYGVLDFGDYLSLVTLDSDHTHPIDGAQTQWLEKTLAARKDRPNLLCSYHVPAWPSVRSYYTSTCVQERKYWVPLFERYGVDACYEHHDHAYKRTFPIKDNKPNVNGVIYLGDGGCSEPKGRMPKPPGGAFTAGRWYLAKTGRVNNFHLLTIDGPNRLHQAINMQGQIFDELLVTDGTPIMMIDPPYMVTWRTYVGGGAIILAVWFILRSILKTLGRMFSKKKDKRKGETPA